MKDLLYAAIKKIGKEEIRIDIINEIKMSEPRCNQIIEECKKEIGSDLSEESLANLCEALLHFLLTASMLPSERKISLGGVELDLVIPSLKTLNKSPDKALIIQIIKGDEELAKVNYAGSIQPHDENIWTVSAKHLETKYKNYYVDSRSLPFSRIIMDINGFLARKGDRGLKLLH